MTNAVELASAIDTHKAAIAKVAVRKKNLCLIFFCPLSKLMEVFEIHKLSSFFFLLLFPPCSAGR
jgi:hypothetical protein